MANIIDISGKLEAAKPKLKLDEDEIYDINDDKNIILSLDKTLKDADSGFDEMETLIKLLLGDEAFAQLEEKHPKSTTSISGLMVLSLACRAAIEGVTYDEVEARFRKESAAE